MDDGGESALGWAAVHAFEAEHGVVLPEPYRTFVAEVSDGSFQGPPVYGLVGPAELPDDWGGRRGGPGPGQAVPAHGTLAVGRGRGSVRGPGDRRRRGPQPWLDRARHGRLRHELASRRHRPPSGTHMARHRCGCPAVRRGVRPHDLRARLRHHVEDGLGHARVVLLGGNHALGVGLHVVDDDLDALLHGLVDLRLDRRREAVVDDDRLGAEVDRRGQVGGLLGVVCLGVVHREVDADGLGLRLRAVAPLLEVVAGAALPDQGDLDRARAEGGGLLAGGGGGLGGGVAGVLGGVRGLRADRQEQGRGGGEGERGEGETGAAGREGHDGSRYGVVRTRTGAWVRGDAREMKRGCGPGARDGNEPPSGRRRAPRERGRVGAPGEVSDSWPWSTGASPRTAAARAAASSYADHENDFSHHSRRRRRPRARSSCRSTRTTTMTRSASSSPAPASSIRT